jgi:hypothetical protein
MAEVICRQLICGPPEVPNPFSHVIIYKPPYKLIDGGTGFVCHGHEPGLGCCNNVKTHCSGSSDVLALMCARPEPKLIKKVNAGLLSIHRDILASKSQSPVIYTPAYLLALLICVLTSPMPVEGPVRDQQLPRQCSSTAFQDQLQVIHFQVPLMSTTMLTACGSEN